MGIPFSIAMQILKRNAMEQFVPWMYGVNGVSVLCSVVAVLLAMSAGFTPSFFVGLFFYAVIAVLEHHDSKHIAAVERLDSNIAVMSGGRTGPVRISQTSRI